MLAPLFYFLSQILLNPSVMSETTHAHNNRHIKPAAIIQPIAVMKNTIPLTIPQNIMIASIAPMTCSMINHQTVR